MSSRKIIAPKPDNFDELTRTWDDPAAFAREKARYCQQLADEIRSEHLDITSPRRGGEER